jgi:hypothetical protein
MIIPPNDHNLINAFVEFLIITYITFTKILVKASKTKQNLKFYIYFKTIKLCINKTNVCLKFKLYNHISIPYLL